MKTLYIKITGVRPNELAELHALYEDGIHLKSTSRLRLSNCSPSIDFVTLSSSKLDNDGTYTVEFVVVPKMRGEPPSGPKSATELRAPRCVVDKIWAVLGIFENPDTEELANISWT